MQTEQNFMTNSADVIQQVIQHAEKLKDLLNREYDALLARDVELINALVSEKEVLLNALAELEPQLLSVHNTSAIREGEHSVQQLIHLCRELNERNHALVMVAIDQNRKSLSLLRSVLKLDDASEYTAKGELNADRSKRYLGNA